MNPDLIRELKKQIEGCLDAALVISPVAPQHRWKVSMRIARHIERVTNEQQLRALVMLLDELAAEFRAHGVSRVQVCRYCGCTEMDACAGGCAWVEENVCSSCVPENAFVTNLLRAPADRKRDRGVQTGSAGKSGQRDRVRRGNHNSRRKKTS